MTTTETAQYLKWKKDVEPHDYAAASSYLSIRFGESRAGKVAAELRRLPVITRRANDILRATGRVPLPLSDPGVLRDLKKVLAGERLSPILVAEADIADGYHRISLAYALDPYAEVPLKLGGGGVVALLKTRGTRRHSSSACTARGTRCCCRTHGTREPRKSSPRWVSRRSPRRAPGSP